MATACSSSFPAETPSDGLITVIPGIVLMRAMSSKVWWLAPSSPTVIPAWVEGYARKHSMDEKTVFEIFHKFNLLHLLRSQYEVLHTQDLDESVFLPKM